MKTIKTAIFGTGFMGRVHLEAVRRVESVEAAAISGRNDDAAARLAAALSRFPKPGDYREVLRDPAIDAVHICTPNAQHFSMAKEALQAGKHVLCEKPLTTTVAEAEELVALAASRKLRNCVCHNLRYYPQVQQMRAHARSRRTRRNSGRAGNLLPGLAALRHRLELARETQKRQGRRAAWPISARTFLIWPSTSPDCA